MWDINADEEESKEAGYMQEEDDGDYEEDKDIIPATKSATRVLSLVEGITGEYCLPNSIYFAFFLIALLASPPPASPRILSAFTAL